jgi:predicted GIY-YIG superfamily endonuclease
MTTIYVIRCEGNHYYIGKTERLLNSRILEHFSNYGCEWTKKYRPIEVIEEIETDDDMDEDYYTKIYMRKHGIDNVRGGSYVRKDLHEYQLRALQD